MADLQKKILDEYGFDITQENVFKLYKINDANIVSGDLQKAIVETRRRWSLSINGANEKNAERDRLRLEKADQFEAVLKNDKLRKELFRYYSRGKEQSNEGAESLANGPEFAREYFEIVRTTRKIKTSDVDFFFNYFQSERKNKKAILEMLEKDFKVRTLGKEERYESDNFEDVEKGKKKDKNNPLITNLFQQDTIIKIQRCIEFYKQAQQNDMVCKKYPEVNNSLYDFLNINDIDELELFSIKITEKKNEVYQAKQELGNEFIPLVNLFNRLDDLLSNKDVVDNFVEFKLLIKYPMLSPYMYPLTEMKNKTLKGIFSIASREYRFRDDSDFVLNYYNPIHDNFGIANGGGIEKILKKAEKKATTNKILNKIDEKIGTSIGAHIIHWAVYFPILAVYLVFETFKAIITELYRLSYPVFAVAFLGANWIFPKVFGIKNLLYLRNVFRKEEWIPFLESFMGDVLRNGFEVFVVSLMVIIVLLCIYILPSLFVAWFVYYSAADMNERYDWIGYERTFQNIFSNIRKKTDEHFFRQRNTFYKDSFVKVIINMICVAVAIGAIRFMPLGFKRFSDETGFFKKSEKIESMSQEPEQTDANEEQEPVEGMLLTTMVITESSANIRSGPGTDYEVVTTAQKGDTFMATGNEETADNGRIWYEIFLDENKDNIGWASQKVISPQ